MSSIGEVKGAVRLAQKYNTNLYRYLINGLVDNSLKRSELKVELEEYTRSSMKFFDRLYQIRDSKIPCERVQEEQINVFQEQVKRNDKLKVEVHKIQRRLWNLRANGQRVPMANKNMILQGFPELCVSTSPDQVPLTVLCEKLIHKYSLRNERSIKDLLKWAKEQSISRQIFNIAPTRPIQTEPSLPDFVKPTLLQTHSAEPMEESYDVTPVMSWEDASVQVEANLPINKPVQLAAWSFNEREEPSCPTSKQEKTEQYSDDDYYPDFNRKYPIFAWEELAEMFLKPRNRNVTPKPKACLDVAKPTILVPKVQPAKKIVAVLANTVASSKKENTRISQPPGGKAEKSKTPNITAKLQKENLNIIPTNTKLHWNLGENKGVCFRKEGELSSLKSTKSMDPTVKGSSLATKLDSGQAVFKIPAVNTVVPSLPPRNVVKEKPHSLVGSDRPDVYINKIKRSQHDPKSHADYMASAESLHYQQKRADLLAELDLKEQRIKNALSQQYKSKEGKSSIHFYKVDNGPKAEKANTAIPTVPAKYTSSIRRDTFLMSNDNQNSRKRPASSSDDSDSSIPATKKAKHQHGIVLKLFRKGSEWNVKQVIERC